MDRDRDKEYMRIALEHAKEALEQAEFPVGVVFVHRGAIVATGKRLHSHEQTESVNEIDHAEVLGLRRLLDEKPDIPLSEVVVYATMEPCLMCFSTLILNGIHNIVYGYEDVMGGGTNLPLQQLNPLYREMKVNVIPHVLRAESLELFQRFFSDPENLYWKDSLLANYTLSQ